MSSLLSAGTGSALDDKMSMCLSPQDKLKGSTKVALAQRKKAQASAVVAAAAAVSAFAAAASSSSSSSVMTASKIAVGLTVKTSNLAMEVDVLDVGLDIDDDLDLDLVEDDEGDEDMDAGWISDDNLRALEFDDRVNQDIDWVTHDDVDTSLKLNFVPGAEDVQDFGFDPSSFLSPLRGGLSFDDDDTDMASSFAESLSVDTPPMVNSPDAEKLLMSFDTMNFTIPSPTSSSTKKQRLNLFGKKDADDKAGAKNGTVSSRSNLATKGSMSPSLKLKASQLAGSTSEESRKDDPRPSLSKLSIPSPEPFLGVLSITTPTNGLSGDSKKKIGSYSPEARRQRIQKFHEKRKNRTWKKSIKYDCRKKLADDRPRIKGRFVRVLENVDIKEEDSCSQESPSTSPSSPALATPPSTPAATASLVAPAVQPAVPLAALPAAGAPPAIVVHAAIAPVARVSAMAKAPIAAVAPVEEGAA